MDLTPYDCLQVFLDETDSKFCQSIQNTMNNCLFKPYVLNAYFVQNTYPKTWISIRFIDLEFTIKLTFQYKQSRFVLAMIQKDPFAKETAVVL